MNTQFGLRLRDKRRLAAVVAGLTLVMTIGLTGAFAPVQSASAADSISTIWSDAVLPAVTADPDNSKVQLGLEFVSKKDGWITAIEFYKSKENVGPHLGVLWGPDGTALARVNFTASATAGWQRATLASPQAVVAGTKYVASYIAPTGRYADDRGVFSQGKMVSSGDLTALRGLYTYGSGVPNQVWNDSNYYVDVQFMAKPATATTPTRTTTVAPPPARTTTAAPPPARTTTAAPTTVAPTAAPRTSILNLPRIPWEGGPAYWKQFRNADAGGWGDPSFFPIVVWYNGISSNQEVQYDKSVGINTYIGMDSATPFSLFTNNGVFWIGGKLNSTFTETSPNWVGDFLDDEVDGRYTPAAGQTWLQSLVDPLTNDGRFKYANFTQMVIGDLNKTDAEKFINGYTDAVSLDMYWYTIPFCDWDTYRGGIYVVPVDKSNCRTASSYGKSIKSLRVRDAADGKLQAPWQFIEDLNGGPGEGPFLANITAGQLKGAVMSSVVNEARGIVYFNQSLSGPCQGGSIFRQSQVTPNFCGASQVAAAKEVNGQIRQLAPVINTQSYQWNFGSGLDTMLKTSNGYAYIFSMVDGSSTPGSRTLQLPTGVSGSSAEVLFENRTIPINGSRQFTDSYAAEYSYHIYKVKL